jgi:hypothetical protein
MDRTLLLSRRSSSSCSRIDGVIRERTISVRFSRLMKKKTPAESTRRGRRCPQTGGEAAGSNSCGPSLAEQVGPDQNSVYAERLFDLHREIAIDLPVSVLVAPEGGCGNPKLLGNDIRRKLVLDPVTA